MCNDLCVKGVGSCWRFDLFWRGSIVQWYFHCDRAVSGSIAAVESSEVALRCVCVRAELFSAGFGQCAARLRSIVPAIVEIRMMMYVRPGSGLLREDWTGAKRRAIVLRAIVRCFQGGFVGVSSPVAAVLVQVR